MKFLMLVYVDLQLLAVPNFEAGLVKIYSVRFPPPFPPTLCLIPFCQYSKEMRLQSLNKSQWKGQLQSCIVSMPPFLAFSCKQTNLLPLLASFESSPG